MGSALSSPDNFGEKIRWCFGNLAELVGVDYILLVSQDKARDNSLNLNCHFGLPEESLSAIQYDWQGSASHVDDFINKVSTLDHA